MSGEKDRAHALFQRAASTAVSVRGAPVSQAPLPQAHALARCHHCGAPHELSRASVGTALREAVCRFCGHRL